VFQPTRVLFICLHGAAKSIIAAEYFRRRAAAADLDVEVNSGGLEPDAEISPPVVAGLAADGFDVAGLVPPALNDGGLASADVIVSFGCAIEDRIPSRSVIRWDDVPLVSDGYVAARDEIVRRVDALVATVGSERMSAPRD
jgi:arsenate reductase (thioredoxin)